MTVKLKIVKLAPASYVGIAYDDTWFSASSSVMVSAKYAREEALKLYEEASK